MKEQYIIVHDMGTSSDKAAMVTVHGRLVAEVKKEYPIFHPAPGFAEQNPEDLWDAICSTTRELVKITKTGPDDIAGITMASQSQCILPVDKEGVPLRPMISWLDGRSADIMRTKVWKKPKIQGYNPFLLLRYLKITGGAPGHTGKDQIGKLLWLKENEPEIFNNTYKFLDAKDYITFKLTGNMVTSIDLAYIWWMLDSRKKDYKWHDKLCKLAGITPEQLSEIRESSAVIGEITEAAAKTTGLKPGIPVVNGASDLAASAIGSGALGNEEFHICVGTSGWVAGHAEKRKIDLAHYAGCMGSGYPYKYYLAMAHQETSGVCLEWLKNNVLYHKQQIVNEANVHEVYQVLDQLAEQAGPGAGGLMFTPWMYGERCPLNDDHIRGGLFNVSLDHSREHIIRAVFEGIAFNTRWALETLEKLYKKQDELPMIGGGAKSDIWCQIMADITNRKIKRVANPQQSAGTGAALLASLGLGYIKSFDDIPRYIKYDKTFSPNPENREMYDRLFKEFKNIYKQNKSWYKRINQHLS